MCDKLGFPGQTFFYWTNQKRQTHSSRKVSLSSLSPLNENSMLHEKLVFWWRNAGDCFEHKILQLLVNNFMHRYCFDTVGNT